MDSTQAGSADALARALGLALGSNEPYIAESVFAAGAGDRNRTRNLLFTKQLLCQLSYAGVDSEG